MSLETEQTEQPVSQEQEPILRLEGVKKHFDQTGGFLDRLLGHEEIVRAVDGVDLSVNPGETVAIVGESGCGKSTLGKTILNLLEPTAGEIWYEDTELTSLSDSEMRPYRTEMQMIFQDPLASLNPRKRVGDILMAPLQVHDIGGDDTDREQRAKDMLERVGLKRDQFRRYPHTFSGGQQQRVGIARALMSEPDLLIADEPTSALDVSVQAQILNLLEDLQEEFGLSMVFITHDLSVVRYIADKVAVMYLGEFVEVGPTKQLFNDPSHPYTRSLLSAVPRIEAGGHSDRIVLEGTVPSPIDPPAGCRFHTRCPQLIPSTDWDGTQQQFRSFYTFYDRVTRSDIKADDIRQRLESEGMATSEEAVVDYILSTTYEGNYDALPGDAQTAMRTAAEALMSGEKDEAVSSLDEVISTPCRDKPEPVSVGDGSHTAACHLLSADSPGDQSHYMAETDRK